MPGDLYFLAGGSVLILCAERLDVAWRSVFLGSRICMNSIYGESRRVSMCFSWLEICMDSVRGEVRRLGDLNLEICIASIRGMN